VRPEPHGYPSQETKEARTMKNTNRNTTQSLDPADALRRELACKIASFIGLKEKLITDIPGLLLTRRIALTAPASTTYEPSLAVVAQGRKRADLGGATFIFDETRYLLTSLDCNKWYRWGLQLVPQYIIPAARGQKTH
jgi:hypothetical protein